VHASGGAFVTNRRRVVCWAIVLASTSLACKKKDDARGRNATPTRIETDQLTVELRDLVYVPRWHVAPYFVAEIQNTGHQAVEFPSIWLITRDQGRDVWRANARDERNWFHPGKRRGLEPTRNPTSLRHVAGQRGGAVPSSRQEFRARRLVDGATPLWR
jgi:hypothetical protein